MEAYAAGRDVEAGGDEPDWDQVRGFIDGLEGELLVERDPVLPLPVDGETVAISGVVDLVAVTDDRVTVVDFKTDRGRGAREEYRKQLCVYWHVLEAAYPDRTVDAVLFWTAEGEAMSVEPLPKENLANLVRVRAGR